MVIQLAPPDITKEDCEAVQDALQSSWINIRGPYVDKLENLLKSTLGASEAVCLSNGTSALFLALKAIGIKSGDKVAVPSITFVATINAILQAGGEPIFFDCDNELNINVNHLEQFLSKHKVDCILPVHMFGNPCKMDKILYLAEKHNIKVVEDSCESLGSIYYGQHCGTLGDIGAFSFSFNKMITSGNGGAIVTNDETYAQKIRYWASQSKDNDLTYIHNEPGYNMGLTNIQAALGYSQLKRLDPILAAKKRIFNLYCNRLGKKLIAEEGTNNWFIAYNARNKDRLILSLREEGIEVRPLFFPNHLQRPFRYYEQYGNLENSVYWWNHIVNLPCGVNITSEEINYICDRILDIEGD